VFQKQRLDCNGSTTYLYNYRYKVEAEVTQNAAASETPSPSGTIKMASQYFELVCRLQKLISLLDKYDEKSWGKFFNSLKGQVENGNRQGVVALTQVRGGMGSFYDLVICRINGHDIQAEDEAKVNEELMQLAEDVFSLARQIRITE
jgi:hypothetical protein